MINMKACMYEWALFEKLARSSSWAEERFPREAWGDDISNESVKLSTGYDDDQLYLYGSSGDIAAGSQTLFI